MIRRFLTRILIVVLIAACVYNWQQTQILQAQVAALQAQAARSRQATVLETRSPETSPGLAALPGQWSHYKQKLLTRTATMWSTSKKVLSYVKL